MERVKRDKERKKPSKDINISWEDIVLRNFKTILVSILFILVLLLLVFLPDMQEKIQTILIAILGSFAGFIIGKKIS